MRSVSAEFKAIFNSRAISRYLEGVETSLPNGQRIKIKVEKIYRSIRTSGLRFSKFSFVSEVHAGGEIGFGYGESESKLLSSQKSIVEGIERVIYKLTKQTDPQLKTSNGWAAHLNVVEANQSARDELFERDAILSHWFNESPFLEIDVSSAPKWITDWGLLELTLHPRFKRLRLLITTNGFLPAVMTLLESESGHALISQATAETLEAAIYRALAETCRIGEIEAAEKFKDSSLQLARNEAPTSGLFSPVDHAMVYAYHIPVPQWVYGDKISWQSADMRWREQLSHSKLNLPHADFTQVIVGPVCVGYCTSPNVQKLFFGRTDDAEKDGLINLNRIEKLKHARELCRLPHCVP